MDSVCYIILHCFKGLLSQRGQQDLQLNSQHGQGNQKQQQTELLFIQTSVNFVYCYDAICLNKDNTKNYLCLCIYQINHRCREIFYFFMLVFRLFPGSCVSRTIFFSFEVGCNNLGVFQMQEGFFLESDREEILEDYQEKSVLK